MHREYTTNFPGLVERELRPPQVRDGQSAAGLCSQIAVGAEDFGMSLVVLEQVIKSFRPLPDTDKVRGGHGRLIPQKLK